MHQNSIEQAPMQQGPSMLHGACSAPSHEAFQSMAAVPFATQMPALQSSHSPPLSQTGAMQGGVSALLPAITPYLAASSHLPHALLPYTAPSMLGEQRPSQQLQDGQQVTTLPWKGPDTAGFNIPTATTTSGYVSHGSYKANISGIQHEEGPGINTAAAPVLPPFPLNMDTSSIAVFSKVK